MKIKSILFTFLIIMNVQSFGQEMMIAQYKGFNGKWGYVTMKGEEITEAIYGDCRHFQGGLARVNEKRFINAKGEELNTSFKIQEARDCVEGYAAVMVKGKWGLMNVKGELMAPAIYKKVTDFNEGRSAGFNNESLDIFDVDGNKIEVKLEKGKISEKGKLFLIKPFHEEMAAMAVDFIPGPNDELRFGFIDKLGQVVVKPKYLGAGDFHEGLAWVRTLESKFGFIDKKGNEIIKPTYTKVGNFHEGIAWIKSDDGKIGFINKEGTMIVEPKYKKVFKFYGDLALALGEGGKFGYVNTKGEEVIAIQFSTAGNFDPVSGMARVVLNKVKGYVNSSGDVNHFQNTKLFKHFSGGLSPEKKNKLIGFIDNTGEWAIEPKYRVATGFKNEFSKVKMFVNRKFKWGIINTKGEYVIEPKYMKIYEFYSSE